MKKGIVCMAAATGLFLLYTNITTAMPFDPLFRIANVNGDCMLAVPDETGFAPAVDGKAYPFGTRVKTAANSTADIQLSEGNTCHMNPSTVLAVNEESPEGSTKRRVVIKLQSGKVDLDLEKGFHEANSLSVETLTSTCEAIGCKFTVESRRETDLDLTVVLIQCADGQIGVHGPNFDIPLLEKDDALSVSGTSDRLSTRLRSVRGTFALKFKDSNGNDKSVEIKPNSIVKIYRQVGDDNAVSVTTFITKDDGSIIESGTYSEALTEEEQGRQSEEEQVVEEGKQGEEEQKGEEKAKGEDVTFATTTTTTTTTTTVPPTTTITVRSTTTTTVATTTTTTVPSPTPVGLR